MGAGNQPWRLSLAVSEDLASTILQLGSILYVSAGAAGVVVAVTTSGTGLLAYPALVLAIGCFAIVGGVAMGTVARLIPGFVRDYFPQFLYGQVLGTPLIVSAGLVGVGPSFGVVAALYVEVPIYAVYLLRPAVATLTVALATAEFAVVACTQSGWPRPGLLVLFVGVVLASSSFVFGKMLNRGYKHAEQLSAFRRFLPEAVADAVVAGGDTSIFDPHRRAIGVMFCDLRGFTHFAATASPEDIQDVLDAYFRLVGSWVHELGATVGSITGDGIMAYFGDPIPCPDPADRALELAHRLREPMDDLVAGWTARGFELSYGIGIAHGHATLGVVGFEGRNDYTALGPVVNLAARLSDAAGPREVLVDQRAMAEAAQPPSSTTRTVALKGYDQPVIVHKLAAIP